jgi:hypothetical protein
MDKALLSVPELVDSDCNVNFDKNTVVVINNKTKQIILKGRRDPATRLWLVPIVQQQIQLQQEYKFKIPTSVPHAANSAYHQKKISKLIQFLHATAGSPPVETWCKAIDDNFFSTWPGLTSQAVRKHLPKSIATTMGHLHMIRKGIGTTNKPTIEDIMEEEVEPEPELETPRSIQDRKHYDGIESFKFEDLKGISATDLPGRFPVTSYQGNAYVMVMYDTNSNAIQAVPIKTRKTEELVRGY